MGKYINKSVLETRTEVSLNVTDTGCMLGYCY
jgi:hypothetical protein